MPKTLKPNDPAPDFALPTADGHAVRLSDLKDRRVVLYFYPKDDTPGCTQEAQDFTQKAEEFAALNTAIIGVSRDSAVKHRKFADKHGLKITLASDEDGATCQKYGVWVEKTLYGRTSMGIERSTFLIGAGGRISRIWRKVRVRGHVDEILTLLKE